MATVKVLQIVGYKNSGKTTLLLQLLQQAQHHKKVVATIKHHGHNSELEMPNAYTDSMRQFSAGAACAIAYGNGMIQLHQRQPGATLDELIALAYNKKPEIILVEGFKEANYEKIVLLDSQDDWTTLQNLHHIRLVLSKKVLELDKVPLILQNDSKQIESWFTNWMDGDSGESI